MRNYDEKRQVSMSPAMEFSSSGEMKKIEELANSFYEHILDDKPFFVSDEATIWDVSGAEPQELLDRISAYYGATLAASDLQQPLWKAGGPGIGPDFADSLDRTGNSSHFTNHKNAEGAPGSV